MSGRRSRRRRAALAAALAAAALSCAGCRCSDDRPYTPFHIDPNKAFPTASASASASASAAAASADVPAGGRRAELAPKDVSEWMLDGVVLRVAPDRLIERALAADFDGDGQKDAIAWTRARSEPADTETTGELVFMGPKVPAPGRVLSTLPPFMPTGPGCHHTVSLELTGPRTATLDVQAKCQAALLPRSPTRGVVVLAPAGDRTTVLELRVADPAPGETLSLTVDSSDRDGDGRDDVRVTVGVGAEGDPSGGASADLVWLDRTAGPSRDAAEPSRSLSASIAMETHHGSKTSDRVAAARRLYATLCEESGTPRIFDADGAAFDCPGIANALSSLLVAEVRSFAARHDAIGASAALGRDGWYQTSLPARQRASLEKQVRAAWPKRSATERQLEPLPRQKSGLPRFSPLAFEPGGTLLIQTADGVVRVHDDGRSEDASESVDVWPLGVGTGVAPRWTGIAFPCERSDVQLLESDPTGTPLPSSPTSIVAPRPGPCIHPGPLPTPSLTPLEWTETRQAGLIGGALFGVNEVGDLSRVPQKGSPRSPDGKSLVVPGPLGLVVVTGGKAEIWTVQDGAALSDCVVEDGAACAACIRGNRASWFSPEASHLKKKKKK